MFPLEMCVEDFLIEFELVEVSCSQNICQEVYQEKSKLVVPLWFYNGLMLFMTSGRRDLIQWKFNKYKSKVGYKTFDEIAKWNYFNVGYIPL